MTKKKKPKNLAIKKKTPIRAPRDSSGFEKRRRRLDREALGEAVKKERLKVRNLQRRLNKVTREAADAAKTAVGALEAAADAVDDGVRRIDHLRNTVDNYETLSREQIRKGRAREMQVSELLHRVERREAMVGRLVMQMADRHSTISLTTTEVPVGRFVETDESATCDKPGGVGSPPEHADRRRDTEKDDA